MKSNDLHNSVLSLEEEYMIKLDKMYDIFSQDVAALGLVKSYLSNKQYKLLSDVKALSETLENRIHTLLNDIYIVNTSAYEKAWKVGEGVTEAYASESLNKNILSKLRKDGLFDHRSEAMNAFKINKKSFDISTRVWKEGIKGQIEGALQLGVLEGQTAQGLGRALREYLKEPERLYRRIKDKDTGEFKLSKAARDYHPGQGVYRSSYLNARRLVATEINNSYRMSEWESYQSNPCIIGYQIRLSNNHTLINPKTRKPERFVDICDYAAGKYPKDFKWYGWHSFCRCIMTPIFAFAEDTDAMTQAILDGKDPYSIKPKQIEGIPDKFKDWSIKHRKQISGWSEKPKYITNNPKYQDHFIYKKIFSDKVSDKAKAITLSRNLYQSHDVKLWHRDHFDKEDGGFLVTSKDRIAFGNKNKQELAKFNKEHDMCMVFAKNGYKVEHLSEVSGIASPDVIIDGFKGDLKHLSSHNNIVKEAKSAIRKQHADMVLFQFDKMTPEIHHEINKLTKLSIKGKYFVTGDENNVVDF